MNTSTVNRVHRCHLLLRILACLLVFPLTIAPPGADAAETAAAQPGGVSEDDERLEPFVETHPDGRIDWDRGVIYGVGVGYLDRNGGLKNQALQAARAAALQSLLRIASGLRLDDRETLKTLGGGRVAVQLRGLVRHDTHEVRVSEKAERPHVEVTLRAPLSGVEGLTVKLLDLLKGSAVPWDRYPQPPQPPSPGSEEGGPETWLVVDARRLPGSRKVLPALFPKILTPFGEALYDLTKVDRDALAARGMAKYVVSSASAEELRSQGRSPGDLLVRLKALFDVRDAQAGEKKKKKKRRRFIITDAKQAEGLNRTDLLIDSEDVRKLETGGAAEDILRKCRVIIVVNSPIGGVEGSLDRLLAFSKP